MYDKKIGIIDFSDIKLILSNQYISIRKQPRFFPDIPFASSENLLFYAYSGISIVRTVQRNHAVSVELSPGDFFFSNGNEKRTILCSSEDAILLYFIIYENGTNQDMVFHTGRDVRITNYIDQMLQETRAQKKDYQKIIYMTFELLNVYLKREYQPCDLSGLQIEIPDHASVFTDYLQSHFSDFSLAEMADAFHMSISHLCCIYKQHTGSTILSTLQQYRISIAKYLLSNTAETVDAVSMQIGYTDTSYFIKIFRQSCGCTPGKYRQMNN